MTVADSPPQSECLAERFDRLSWFGKKVVERAYVGERHGFSATVTRFPHQAQRFAVALGRLAPRLAGSFALQFCAGDVGTLGGNACAVCLSCRPQLVNPKLVTSSSCFFLQRAHIEQISAAAFRDQRNDFHASRAAQVVINFENSFSIGSRQTEYDIDTPLLHDDTRVPPRA